ncbi:carbohydrate ABC transporter substrate-binding protein, CUT1 family [Leifsonia sp. 98AMF]|uniref:ABC transporter substrate-binding protein n=1 Tax=unclassified Leifsonia TaxID=2663824 RepID=UPI00087D9A8C|nr:MULTISPECIES: ABC transporter substrate-binding protein [unclassified Leifsonia]SDH10109.1 carbohydrate ABC transporter substrate-binding protein, CUT1 family [Leifsonia sp. 197AMF]SDJ29076.1 carbohydrate ABC transporter substrate-binding protein, CUT1 family [Leifsonia sp. 466MF]SDK51612.1 carbohydrate ABC transporter substrate-binding protein, CUT1 family [Leifsonia sp. 157MF]SDN50917.1 carbohydrate ABC transporter substrate-binding protein, CUT1 family [Leifsonia sp. 509MF]SEN59371.1 car
MKIAWKGAASIAAIAAAAALVLSGCSDPGSGGGSAGSASWPAQDTKLDGVDLTIWAAQNSNKTPESVITGFEKLTGAKVKVVTIPDPYEQGVQTKVATGDKPDLAFWQPTASELTALNATQNLQSLEGAPWVKNYTGNLADMTGTLDGTRYAALVTTPAVIGVYYNKEVFSKNGITATPKNWDEFIALAEQLKAKGVDPFYEMGGDKWATQWWVQAQLADAAKDGLWDKVNKNEEKFTDPTIQGAIDNYQKLIQQGLFNADIKTATFVDQGNALLGGKAAMAMQVNSFFGELQATSNTEELNKKIGFFPISPKGNVGTYIPDQSNALVAFKTGDSKREAAARQFLSYWLGDGYADFVKAQSTVSLIKGVDTPSSVPTALTDVAASLDGSVGSMQALAVANPDLYLNLADMIQGTKTPVQVAEATQAQFAQLAKAQGVKGF